MPDGGAERPQSGVCLESVRLCSGFYLFVGSEGGERASEERGEVSGRPLCSA